MRHLGTHAALVLLGLGVLTSLGCKSISASLTSPFDSSSGFSESISGSFEALSDGISTSCSGREATPSELALGEDVRVLTRSLAEDGDAAALHLALREVSAPHGVVDYAAIPDVWHGVGVGLAQSGLSQAELDAWLVAAGVDDAAQRVHVGEGFAAVPR